MSTKAPNIYFLADAHLGSLAIPHPRMQERRLVNFLTSIKSRATAIYLLGDMFDFWHEYKEVVPKGYTRLLGKISELTDAGVEVHYFTGNHDLWQGDYLQRECGVILHRTGATLDLLGSTFYLAHGDGLDPTDTRFRLLRALFHSHLCQRLFAALHPRIGVRLGLLWAAHSRRKRENGAEPPIQDPENESLVRFARQYIATHPDINYFIFGHRHIPLDLTLTPTARLLLLGDWITHFSYIHYDGTHLRLLTFDESAGI